MRILVDTNVFIDIFENRDEFVSDSYNSLKKILSEGNTIYISSSSIKDINYILTKYFHSNDKAKEISIKILGFCKIASLDESSIFNSFLSEFSDFEDAIIESVAMNNFCPVILTRNKKDFRNSELKVYTPKEYLLTTEMI